MSREIMQQALDALTLECCDNDGNPVDLKQPAIEALEAELAKPEPVVSFTDNDEGLWIQLECNGTYYCQNLSETKIAKFFVKAYRSKNT
jgi:hypothetical protein